MTQVAASFPTSVWTGATETRGADTGMPHQIPTAEDFERIYAEVKALQDFARTFSLANILTASGLKLLVGDGVDASGGDAQATFTGAVIGQRVLGVVGLVKTDAGTTSHALETLAPGTDVEAAVTVTNKIVFKLAAGDKSAKTYFAVVIPAATLITA